MSENQIVIAVTGGVAAFKTAALTSKLVQSGYSVRAIMTPAAEKFVGRATFAALTGKPVVTDLFDPAFPLGAHIELARSSSLLCVAPATANFLAKAANGISDDLLSTLYLCFTESVIAVPAMNCEMWEKAAVQRNVNQLRDDGVQIVDPQDGWLSCRTKGVGRMAEPTDILAAIEAILKK
jgi:phosphopantothenoylcysteine decarboxylase/phosphopantothenate--cysteine ligase